MTRASKRECAPSALTGIKPSLATTSADNRSNASVKPAPNKTFLTALSSGPLGYLGCPMRFKCQQVNSANDSTRESEKSRLLISPARAPINNIHYSSCPDRPHFGLCAFYGRWNCSRESLSHDHCARHLLMAIATEHVA